MAKARLQTEPREQWKACRNSETEAMKSGKLANRLAPSSNKSRSSN